jgi:hypothetical protein
VHDVNCIEAQAGVAALQAASNQGILDWYNMFTYAEIWLMLMLMLKYYERKTLFYGWKVAKANMLFEGRLNDYSEDPAIGRDGFMSCFCLVRISKGFD